MRLLCPRSGGRATSPPPPEPPRWRRGPFRAGVGERRRRAGCGGAAAGVRRAGLPHGWPVLQALLENAEGPLTRRAIFRAWPDSAAAPARLTLWKWLSRAVREGHVLQHGRGSRKEPYRYSLPGMVEK